MGAPLRQRGESCERRIAWGILFAVAWSLGSVRADAEEPVASAPVAEDETPTDEEAIADTTRRDFFATGVETPARWAIEGVAVRPVLGVDFGVRTRAFESVMAAGRVSLGLGIQPAGTPRFALALDSGLVLASRDSMGVSVLGQVGPSFAVALTRLTYVGPVVHRRDVWPHALVFRSGFVGGQLDGTGGHRGVYSALRYAYGCGAASVEISIELYAPFGQGMSFATMYVGIDPVRWLRNPHSPCHR